MARGKGFGSVDELPSGRLRARYVGPDKRRHVAPKTFTTRREARSFLAQIDTDIQKGVWVDPDLEHDHGTFGEYAARWLEDRELKPRTRSHYRALLTKRILPTWGAVEITAITAPAVRRWHATVSPGKPTTRAHCYSLLRAILQTALSDGLIDANPAHIYGAGAAPRVSKTKVLTPTELTGLIDAMPEKYRALVAISTWCALRFGEATELRRKDIDLNNGVLHIRRGVVRADGRIVVGTPKSEAGVRDVAIPARLVPIIQAHLDRFAQPGPDGLVFPAARQVAAPCVCGYKGCAGGHLATSTLYKSFYPAREKVGRTDLRWHDLRHTGAVFAALSDATLAELMGRLGHSTPQAALRYQHIAQGRDAEIASRLSDMMPTPIDNIG